MQTSTLRRTSIYTLRFPTREQVQQTADTIDALIIDRGDFAVSWRAGSDTDAIATATRALHAAGLASAPGVVLTTGLGIHRRTVAEN